MRRIVLIGLIALGIAGCQPTDRDMTPVPDAAGSGAPLYDEGLEPGETRDDLGG